MKDSNISILSFVRDKIPYLFNANEKFRKWPDQQLYLRTYNEVPEHTSSVNFILNNLIIEGIEDIDYWNLQRLALDYLIYGGFTYEVQKLRGGGQKLNYVDIGKCRFNPDVNKIGYSENWENYRVDVKWKKITDDISKDGIFYFKNNKSRDIYPSPHYHSALKSLDTMTHIIDYHNNNAKGGFTPSVIVNFNNGEPDDDTKKEIEKKIIEKFTGSSGQKFILSFNETEATKTTIEKLENDNLDQKFETLQKFIQNQIIIAHQITSGQLVGVKPESQGFSEVEYKESLIIFNDVVISAFRRELNYALSKLLNKEVKLAEPPKEQVPDKKTTEIKDDLSNINKDA